MAIDTAPAARPSPHRLTRAAQAFFNSDRLESPHFLVLFWFLTRLAVTGVWALLRTGAQGDVAYYYTHIVGLSQTGPGATMPEYPTPALWVLSVPYLLGFGDSTGYTVAFCGLMLALDAAFTFSLWHFGGRRRGQAIVVWTVFIAFIGPTVYQRFDLITSVLAGWGLISAWRKRPVVAGVLVGLAAAVKLWPALLWPALCGGSRPRARRVTIAMGITGGALAAASLAWAGWDRLISPLTYQSDRGLQVESVFASIPMLLRSWHVGDYAVTISRYIAFEIWGTGVPFWLTLASIAVLAGYALIVITYVIWLIRGHGRMIEGCVLTLLVITVLIVTNKTFSPQYVIWLGGPLAATLLVLGDSEPGVDAHPLDAREAELDKHRLIRIAWLTMAITLATIVVYPIGYARLVNDTVPDQWIRPLVTLVLVFRNAMMVWLLIELVKWTVSFLKPSAWRLARR